MYYYYCSDERPLERVSLCNTVCVSGRGEWLLQCRQKGLAVSVDTIPQNALQLTCLENMPPHASHTLSHSMITPCKAWSQAVMITQHPVRW